MQKYFRDNYHFHLLLVIISFGFVLFNGFRGVYPLDSFIIFNGGYSVLNGYHPFKDYWTISGPIIDYFQALFYFVFGLNWKGYVFHALAINILIVSCSFYLFQKLSINNYFSFVYSLGIAILAYPQTGTPFMDHHAFYFAYLSVIFLSLGIITNRRIFWFLVPVSLFISFFSKQLPAGILFLLIIFFFIFYLRRNIKKYLDAIKGLLLGTIIVLLIFLSWILIAQIPLNSIVVQYFYYPLSIGDTRIDKIGFDLNSFVLQFKFIYLAFLIPFILIIKNIGKKKIYGFPIFFLFLNIFLFITFIFSQIITKNQILIFFLIPYFLAVSHYFTSIFKEKPLYYYFILVLLLFSTIKYHDRFNNHKKFMELNNANFENALDTKILDNKMEGLKWITYQFMSNPKYELDQLMKSKSFIENSKFKYTVITDYQFFPMILELKTVSPAKWYDAMSVPNTKSVYHKKFKEYFKENLQKQKIENVYLIGKGKDKWPIQYMFNEENCVVFSKINEFLYLSNLKKCY